MTKEFNNVYEALQYIQQELNAPKSQYNKFGGYSYRSAEDILAALKPLLADTGCILLCTEQMITAGAEDDTYMDVTAELVMCAHPEKRVCANGLAREAREQKGMTASQLTGSAHSYAKKLALGNLFMIDDTPDDDSTNKHGKGEKTQSGVQNNAKKGQMKQAMDMDNGNMRILNTQTILRIVKEKKAEKLMPQIIQNQFNKEKFNDLTDYEVEVLKNNLMTILMNMEREK